MKVTRRSFLKVTGATVAGVATLSLGLDLSPVKARAMKLKNNLKTAKESTIKNLKNFGRPLSDILTIVEKEHRKEIDAIGDKIIRNHLGLYKTIQFMISTIFETRRMSRIDLTSVRKKGLTNENFIKSQVEFAAMYSALSKTAGKERALELFKMIIDRVAPIAYPAMFPSAEDLKLTGDPWEAWKAYFVALAEACNRAGCNVYEVVENDDETFLMNGTYCAWYEIAKLLGVKEACLPRCYGDDLYFPGACRKIGIEFTRKTTLARGGDCCDFRFDRIRG